MLLGAQILHSLAKRISEPFGSYFLELVANFALAGLRESAQAVSQSKDRGSAVALASSGEHLWEHLRSPFREFELAQTVYLTGMKAFSVFGDTDSLHRWPAHGHTPPRPGTPGGVLEAGRRRGASQDGMAGSVPS